MKEHVSELTPEEFQKTFPIELKDVTPKFKVWYEEERDKIIGVIDKNDVIRINHIGSSAIPNIKAKPVVDIMLEIADDCNVDALIESLKSIDFGVEILMRKDDPFELLLAKGMTVNGFAEKVFLLHIRYAGDWNELYFRDYLLEFPDVAREYGELKEKILEDISEGKMERMPNGKPNGYSMAKFDFVNEVSNKAKERYCNKYFVNR
ncbi:MAG: GrpB family protein [Clostridiales bacterium]|nr:GrpB family protein [Clostridiales bacterium]